MNNILYDKIENVCARDFVVSKLNIHKFTAFVENIYNDMSKWEQPIKITERDVIDRVEGYVSHVVSRSLDVYMKGTNHD